MIPKRLLINRHNGMIGSAHMMRAQCRGILLSCTATDESKDLAQKIMSLSEDLIKSLKTRQPFPEEK